MAIATPLPMEAGDTLKLSTALRIAMNIAIDDAALVSKPPHLWDVEELFEHLESAWNFFWNAEVERWDQQ